MIVNTRMQVARPKQAPMWSFEYTRRKINELSEAEDAHQ